VGSHRARKPRLFSVVTIFEAKVTGDLVRWLGTPPPIAAAMAKKTTDGTLTGEAPTSMLDFVKLHASEFKQSGPPHS
jgi:hypothetical protein